MVLEGHIAWLLLPLLVVCVLAFVGYRTFQAHRTLTEQAASSQELTEELETLRLQNKKLALLESELSELRELQEQMLRLAGIEAVLGVDMDLIEEIHDAQRDGASTGELLVWPAQGFFLRGYSETHRAVDIAGDRGQTVVASGSGAVEYVGSDRYEGRKVRIAHDDTTKTIYSGLSLSLVSVGDSVRVGQVVGLIGASQGDRAHVHFEVMKDWNPVDPSLYIRQKPPAFLPEDELEGITPDHQPIAPPTSSADADTLISAGDSLLAPGVIGMSVTGRSISINPIGSATDSAVSDTSSN